MSIKHAGTSSDREVQIQTTMGPVSLGRPPRLLPGSGTAGLGQKSQTLPMEDRSPPSAADDIFLENKKKMGSCSWLVAGLGLGLGWLGLLIVGGIGDWWSEWFDLVVLGRRRVCMECLDFVVASLRRVACDVVFE